MTERHRIVSDCSGRCPIPATHSRLDQSHELWHQALAAYEDPISFLANLNAAVEALRNVTFILQSERRGVPDFDTWYSHWRTLLADDPVMRWLSDARTTVVHRSDLQTTSTAVAVVRNNRTLASYTVEVAPLVTSGEACRLLADGLPDTYRSERAFLILSLERRWTVPDLPEQELLAVLAHGYGFLSRLVQSAHVAGGSSYGFVAHEGSRKTDFGTLPPCLVTTAEQRTVRLSLADGRILAPTADHAPVDASGATLVSTYGLYAGDDVLLPYEEPEPFAQRILATAKRLLATEKHHPWLVFLRSASGWKTVEVVAETREEKYACMDRLAISVTAGAVDAIVSISENWSMLTAASPPGTLPEESKRRRETLTLLVADSKDLLRAYVTRFTRGLLGRIKFLPTQDVSDSIRPHLLGPVFAAWGRCLDKGSGPPG